MNILDFLWKRLNPATSSVPANQAQELIAGQSKEEQEFFKKFGMISSSLRQLISDQTLISYERSQLYRAFDDCLNHPLMSAASGMFADVATVYNAQNGSTVWVTADNKEYQYQIEKMLDVINLEEVIYDWAWSIATFGDLFVQCHGEPGVGLVSVSDDQHPINVSRVDYGGRLVGFYETPAGYNVADERELLPPWEYCLRGNTKIPLLDGTMPTILEMAENPEKYIGKAIWSINPKTQELELDEIEGVKKTRSNAEMVRIWLDNEKYIDCTPDHRIMLRSGGYKEAQYLVEGESLMPYYTKFNKNIPMSDYEMVYNPGTKKYNFTHKLVIKLKEGIDKVERGNIVHHKDFNRLNNEPQNLGILSISDHNKVHKHGGRKKIYHLKATCETCGKEFEPPVENKEQKYCSRECYGMWNKGLTKETDRTVKANAENMRLIWEARKAANPELTSLICPHCDKGFETLKQKQHHVWYCKNREYALAYDKEYREKQQVLNHKVVKVEKLNIKEDVYDLQIKKNHNFPVESGVFVHNCHFRLLGAKKRRPVYGMGNQPQYSEYRSISIMTPDVRRLTSKYGTSVLADALPIWKRLRLAEDSVLMARISRGVLRYIYKISIDPNNANNEAVASMIDNYVRELKRSRSLDTSGSSTKNYQDRFSGLAGLEDIIIPVWGDTNNVDVSSIGGEVDIKWITDVEELRNQLSTALKVPLGLLAGYGKETPPALGQGSLERLDIRFARQARRIQRAIINGLTRMAQIHLAYQGIDPDLNLFQIHMSETSSAEELELQEALDRGVDVVQKLSDFVTNSIGEMDIEKRELLEYLNTKFLKLNDMDLEKLIKKGNPNAFKEERTEDLVPGVETGAAAPADATGGAIPGGEVEGDGLPAENPFRESRTSSDFKAAIPINKKKIKLTEGENKDKEVDVPTNENWDKKWGKTKVKIKPVKEKK